MWMGSILVKSYLIPKQFCFTLLGCYYTRKWKFKTGHWQGHNSYPLRCSDISGETSSLYACLMSIKKKVFFFLYFFTLLRANRKVHISYFYLWQINIFFFFSVEARWEPATPPFTGKYFFMDKFQHDPWGAPFSTNLTSIFVYFTGLSWLIATFFTVTACSKGGRVSWTIRSIWSVVLLKCVKGFPFLCCGYFKPSTLGYKLC